MTAQHKNNIIKLLYIKKIVKFENPAPENLLPDKLSTELSQRMQL
jgi:hypothetical protein